ncbi:hypothetical protein N7530_010880 [Penicillium desertorum]|uniref:Uncharacterized protein n=1 Tax=Penicillium desertorum TaxID=1303715 RepID=A0A9W9WG64_9EURO|nr:hypothetical protein N7530_010880 [Penicillium desertorum]
MKYLRQYPNIRIILGRIDELRFYLNKVTRLFILPEQRPIEIYTDNINSQLLLSKKGGKLANR